MKDIESIMGRIGYLEGGAYAPQSSISFKSYSEPLKHVHYNLVKVLLNGFTILYELLSVP